MGWETRKGKGRYYTRSRRAGSRVIREYIGTGQTAEMIAGLDDLARRVREERDAACRAQLEALSTADEALEQASAHLDALTRAVLVGAGYRQHKRGEWRRRRHGD